MREAVQLVKLKFSTVSLEDSWMLQVKEFEQEMKSQGYVKVITDTGGFQWIKKY